MIPQMMIALDDPPTLREDILDRRTADRANNPPTMELLRHRFAAVERAEEAHGTFQMSEPWELRQMLIDLAAAAEQWASTLPEPGVLTLRQQNRRARAAA